MLRGFPVLLRCRGWRHAGFTAREGVAALAGLCDPGCGVALDAAEELANAVAGGIGRICSL